MLLVIENNYGETHIVGVGILANEKRPTLKKFFEAFRNDNLKSSEKIRCFMTDKDLTERSIINEVFPERYLYLCQFHVLKALGRAIAMNKMSINSEERLTCLKYLNDIVKSKSGEQYDEIYEKFSKDAPTKVLKYFNNN